MSRRAKSRIRQSDAAGARLAAAPFPVAGEHISGYVRRLARANRLSSLPELYDILGTMGFSQTGGDPQWKALTVATGLPESAFNGLRLPSRSASSSTLVDVGGLRIRTNQMSMQGLSFCPLCLAEGDIVPNRWFVHLITACERHDLQLADGCGNCGKALRTDTVDLGWHCRSCGYALEKMETPPLTEQEKVMASALNGAGKAPPPGALPSGFMKLSAEMKFAVVERLGGIVVRADDDAPFSKKRTFNYGNVDLVKSNRRAADSRAIVRHGIDILLGWPAAYHSLLNSLLDRAPYAAHQLPALRRLATEAGYLAMRPVHSSPGQPVAFIERERTAWLEATFSSPWGARNTRHSAAKITGLDDYSTRAQRDTSGYMTATEALKMLGGGKSPSELAAWVRAELLEVHRNADGYLIPRASVADTVRMFSTLPPDDGREGLTEATNLTRSRHHFYTLEESLIDIAIGHVGAFIRHPTRTGLSALALDMDDITRRRNSAALAALAMEDAFRIIGTIDHYFKAIWGDLAPISALELRAAAAAGHVRHVLPAGTNNKYSIRDLIIDMQGRVGLERVFNLHALSNPGDRRPRELVTQMPRHTGILELTGYASKYTRF